MNEPAERRDVLLADVLAEAEPAAFRDGLLTATLAQVRRRRRLRRALRGAGVLGAVAVLAMAGWWASGRGGRRTGELAGCREVRTHPLAAEVVVTTRAFDPARCVGSQRFAAVVQTLPGDGAVRWVDDAELLALAGKRPVVLVRVGPQEQELIFPGRGERDRRRVE